MTCPCANRLRFAGLNKNDVLYHSEKSIPRDTSRVLYNIFNDFSEIEYLKEKTVVNDIDFENIFDSIHNVVPVILDQFCVS